MTFRLSTRSLDKLHTCDDQLVQVMELAITLTKYDFGITCGVRTLEEQRILFAEGKSLTMNSKHLPNEQGVSRAVDLVVYVNGKVTWADKYYRKVAGAVFKAAFILGIEIEWGGHWENLNDSPHFQLPKETV